MQEAYRILPCGDRAVSVEFGNKADIETNSKVRTFNNKLKEAEIEGITETIPTYRAVMIHYDPIKLSYHQLVDSIDAVGRNIVWNALKESDEVIRIPVLYAAEGSEIQQVAEYEHKSIEEIIRIHSNSRHYVFMLGFSPGGSYIGCPDGSFTIPRKATPTQRPYTGSLGIQTNQSNISAFGGPSGWWSIGRTPVLSFDKRREDPILFKPGQWVEFYPITLEQFDEIQKRVEEMTYEPEIYHRGE